MWMIFDGDEPISGSDFDDPGMCMLFLMRFRREEMAWDYTHWLNMRDERAQNAVRSLFNLAVANKLKEDYLDFVARYIENVGCYKVLYSTITIKQLEPEGDE